MTQKSDDLQTTIDGLHKSITDALYYLRVVDDTSKAIKILSARSQETQRPILAPSSPTLDENLRGMQIAVVVGHEPGGGAKGERAWNIKVAKEMKIIGDLAGANVQIFHHKLKSYGARQAAMAKRIKKFDPDAVLELHYDSYPKRPSAHGAHFQYRGAENLAFAMRDEWHNAFPDSKLLREEGVMKNMRGNGAGFLRAMPVWAILCEPFFISNPEEAEFFKYRWVDVAETYLWGIARWNEGGREA